MERDRAHHWRALYWHSSALVNGPTPKVGSRRSRALETNQHGNAVTVVRINAGLCAVYKACAGLLHLKAIELSAIELSATQLSFTSLMRFA